MEVKIKTINFDADEKLVKFTEAKVNKLDKFFEGIISSEVFLTFDKSKKKHTDNKEAKIKVDIPGAELFAEKQTTTFEESIDLVMDALEKQIKKHKEKNR